LSSKSATILVCEDDPGLRLLFRLTLEPRGHRVVEAGDGSAGILLARTTKPDLIVVDRYLPDLSGIDVVRALRAAPEHENTLILMATGSSQPGDRLEAENAGVDALVYKPFGIDDLVDEIERLLENRSPNSAGLSLRRLH
jgi:two-component system chemotaxis response regulator CheY